MSAAADKEINMVMTRWGDGMGEPPPPTPHKRQGIMTVTETATPRMMALVGELGLTEADLAHLPHQIAAELAEGCLWEGEQYGVENDADWHAIFRAEADIAVAAGLEGIVGYLLCQFWELGVENILHHPQLTSDMSPEDVAQWVRLKLRADATFL